jgi:thioesterase domain-containing protein
VVLGETYPPTMLPEADPLATPDAGRPEVARLLDLARVHGRAARQYRPVPYAGPVVLVQAAEQDAAVRAEAVAVWRALCPDLRAVHVLPGGHYSLLRAPFVAGLARTLRETLPGR